MSEIAWIVEDPDAGKGREQGETEQRQPPPHTRTKTLSRTSDPKLKEMTLLSGVFAIVAVVVDDHDDVQHWLHPPGLTLLQQDKTTTYL